MRGRFTYLDDFKVYMLYSSDINPKVHNLVLPNDFLDYAIKDANAAEEIKGLKLIYFLFERLRPNGDHYFVKAFYE